MFKKWIVLVKLGNNSRGISFSSDGGNDREALEKEIREVYHEEILRTLLSFCKSRMRNGWTQLLMKNCYMIASQKINQIKDISISNTMYSASSIIRTSIIRILDYPNPQNIYIHKILMIFTRS